MAGFHFEGDIKVLKKSHLDFLSGVLEKLGYKGSKVLVEDVGKAGDNYIATVKRFVVNENGKKLNIIAKLAPDHQILRNAMGIENFFKSEEFAYTIMFPKFQQKLIAAGMSENEGIRLPKCYGVYMEVPNEIILLEDLKASSFDTVDRLEPMSNESLKLTLKFLAVFHSLSFVLRYQEPETFAAYQKKLKVMLGLNIMESEGAASYYKHVQDLCVEVLESDKHKQIVKTVLPMSSLLNLKCNKMVKGSKYSVIQHGDAWVTNVMLRSENGVPVECCMVDYQMIRENTPAYDIMFMIFNGTTHKQRVQNFHDYIDHYHNELEKSLSNFGLKANYVYPKEKLEAELKMYGKLVFTVNVMSASLATRDVEEAAKAREVMENTPNEIEFGKSDVFQTMSENARNRFKTKVSELLESYCEFGLI